MKKRMTSICHCKNANYQIDHQDVSYFESWCIENEVLWAHLFEESTGIKVATYCREHGLTTLCSCTPDSYLDACRACSQKRDDAITLGEINRLHSERDRLLNLMEELEALALKAVKDLVPVSSYRVRELTQRALEPHQRVVLSPAVPPTSFTHEECIAAVLEVKKKYNG